MNNKTHIHEDQYNELHKRLALEVVSFFKEKGLPANAWEFHFSFDCLEESVKYGEWSPMSDSCIELLDYNREILYYTM